MAYDGQLSFDTKIDEKGFQTGMSKLGGIAQTALGVFSGQMLTRAIDGVAQIGKSALSSVADLEQNVGGVETLFKDSAQAVIENANRAYETAGMSANDYMQNVTSFSASLLQSVSGDTSEAARIADMAMTDMSDNANKMGTDMQRITDAYQGFAKQNYTMLDNLKLGYGGTKTEMERLLADAEKISGVEYDISNLSDVYEAIHVVQGELGITGTTAQEAATTITGSMNAAKAAWDNFLNGSSSAEELSGSIATAATNIAQSLAEIIPRLAETIPALLLGLGQAILDNSGSIMETGMQILLFLVEGLLSAPEAIFDAFQSIMGGIGDAVSQNEPALQSAGAQILSAITSFISTGYPELLSQGVSIVSNFVNGVLQSIPSVVSAAGNILISLMDAVLTGIPKMLDAGMTLISNLATGLRNNIPAIASSIGQVIGKLIVTITSHLPEILSKGLEIVGKLAAGLIEAIPVIISAAGDLVSSIWDEIKNTDWLSLGGDIISGLIDGLKNGLGRIASAAKEVASGALNAAKEFLGIHSPSRVFRDEIGKNIALGIGDGIIRNVKYAKKSATEAAEDVLRSTKESIIPLDFPKQNVTIPRREIENAVTLIDASIGVQALPAKVYGNEGQGPGHELDYGRMGAEMRDALNGVNVSMDGQTVGRIVSEPVNDTLGGQGSREERDMV